LPVRKLQVLDQRFDVTLDECCANSKLNAPKPNADSRLPESGNENAGSGNGECDECDCGHHAPAGHREATIDFLMQAILAVDLLFRGTPRARELAEYVQR